MIRGPALYVDGNDDRPRATVTQINTTTGAKEAATGLTGLTFRLSATENGAAIHAALSKSATEIGSTGEYTAVFEGADLMTHLDNATYRGKDVFQVFGDGANINRVIARRVEAVRWD